MSANKSKVKREIGMPDLLFRVMNRQLIDLRSTVPFILWLKQRINGWRIVVPCSANSGFLHVSFLPCFSETLISRVYTVFKYFVTLKA